MHFVDVTVVVITIVTVILILIDSPLNPGTFYLKAPTPPNPKPKP